MERFHFNTAISAVMELLNAIPRDGSSSKTVQEALEAMVICLAPIAPHICEELWQELGHKGGLWKAEWPTYDPAQLESAMMTIVVQVNGKLRGRVPLSADVDEETVIEAALADESVKKHVEGKTVRKTIFVPGKLLNIVVEDE